MNETAPAYGLWSLVYHQLGYLYLLRLQFHQAENQARLALAGAFSAFIIALFVEMYGFPLTIYFLSGWLQSKFPQSDIFAHGGGHLWYTLFDLKGDPHTNPIHLLSNVMIFAGFYLTYRAWLVLHAAQREGKLCHHRPLQLSASPTV